MIADSTNGSIEPPTVVCPGCGRNVFREYTTIINGAGEVQQHFAEQSEHDALIEHWDFCPAVPHH